MLALGLYSELYGQDKIYDLETLWKDELTENVITLRNLQREISLTNIKASKE